MAERFHFSDAWQINCDTTETRKNFDCGKDLRVGTTSRDLSLARVHLDSSINMELLKITWRI